MDNALITRKLEGQGNLYISRWMTGLYTERSPLFVPLSAMGLQVISRIDTLWNGENADISPSMTLVRRAGFHRDSTARFGTNDYPLSFFSFKNTSGTIKAIVDTPSNVSWFDSGSINPIFTKRSSTKESFCKVGDELYMCNGDNADMKRWNGTTLSTWGMTAPVTAPTLGFGAGSLTTTSGYKYVYVYKDSTNGHISSASPASANTLVLTSKNITVGGACSTQPRVDKVDVYRTDDGGSLYYYLATVTNTGTTWTYTDSTTDDGLNDDLVAPLADINDPPPSGINLTCFHMGRIWVAASNKLYFGGGPQITNGVPEECFPPANEFTLPGRITAMASTSNGLAVWTQDNLYVVLGTDLISFYVKLAQKDFGVHSQHCVAQDGDLLFVFTSNSQLFQFSTTLTEIGFSIRSRLAASFDPSSSFLALHRNGEDEGLFISNGSTDMYRYSVSMNCWSTVYHPVNGVGCIDSIETDTALYKLLLGRPVGGNYILARSLTDFHDDTEAYPVSATVGAVMLAPPGGTAKLSSLILECMPVGTYPTVSILENEISGTFTELPNPVPDPPHLPPSVSVWSRRHYLKSAQRPLPQTARYIFVTLAFAAEAFPSEVLGLGVQSDV